MHPIAVVFAVTLCTVLLKQQVAASIVRV
jgi:hypothetical protein